MGSTDQMPHAAVITGASSGIGLAISKKLAEMGYEVYGIGRDFAAQPLWQNSGMHPIVCDLLDTGQLCTYIRQIRAQSRIQVLINNAGVG